MNCFIHPAKEASSVCKKCGKAMCINCSAYSNHSGICPACKKEEYEIEQSILINSLKQNKKSLKPPQTIKKNIFLLPSIQNIFLKCPN